MGISIIPNQPVSFHLSDEINCDCNTQPFCQLVSPTDPTQFQLTSNDTVVNGDFEAGLEGWNVFESLQLVADVTNISESGECDGAVDIQVLNGAGPFSFSLNGGATQSTNAYGDLCEGCYFVTVVDLDGNTASIEFCISVSQCDAGTNTLDLLPFKTIDIRNCNTLDFI